MEHNLIAESGLQLNLNSIALTSDSMPIATSLDFQLNGVGNLPQVKTQVPFIIAVKDAIFTSILGQILPVGTVKIESINHLNQPLQIKEQDNSGYSQHNAIAIKATSLSPSMFIKSSPKGNQSPAERRLEAFKIKNALRELKLHIKSDQRFVQAINSALRNCANQFAFSYLHQIKHGEPQPEGFSIEGHWQNLSSASFALKSLSNDSNIHELLMSESDASVSIFLKWVCYYNTFNKTKIETAPLLDFYHTLYNEFRLFHLPALFGINQNEAPHHEYGSLKKLVLKEIESLNKKQSNCFNKPTLEDFLTETFAGVLTVETSSTPSIKLLQSIINAEHQHYTAKSLVLKFAITSLRKIHFAEVFSQSAVHTVVENTLKNRQSDKLSQHLNAYEKCATWVFDKQDSLVHTFIFKNIKMQCYFVPLTQSFVVEHFKKGHKYSFLSASALLTYLTNQPKLDFNLPGIFGWNALERFMNSLIQIESSQLA